MNNILFIILILLFLLGGFAIRNLNSSKDISSFFSSMGLKTKEQKEKEQLDKIMSKFLDGRGKYLDKSQEQIGSLRTIVEKASTNNDNVDILRLKGLMKKFEDQNQLMVEDGQKFLDMEERQKRLNKKMAKEAEVSAFLSKSDEKEVLERQTSALQQQQELLSQMQNQLKQSGLGLDANLDAADKLSSLQEQNQDFMNNLKKNQEQMRDFLQDRTSEQKQKIEDLRMRNQDALDKVNSINQSAQSTNDRINDQMQRLRDKMNK